MSYATYDFSESLKRVPLAPADVERVLAAWGSGDGMGTDAGHFKWAEDSVTQWHGGFLMKLRDSRYAYLTGWCDFTGWGCQDGVEMRYFDTEPTLAALRHYDNEDGYHHEPPESEWDIEPADLNKWLADGGKDPYE